MIFPRLLQENIALRFQKLHNEEKFIRFIPLSIMWLFIKKRCLVHAGLAQVFENWSVKSHKSQKNSDCFYLRNISEICSVEVEPGLSKNG